MGCHYSLHQPQKALRLTGPLSAASLEWEWFVYNLNISRVQLSNDIFDLVGAI